jgi:hypothetical protein
MLTWHRLRKSAQKSLCVALAALLLFGILGLTPPRPGHAAAQPQAGRIVAISDVSDFGARGDGVSDSTAAIIAAQEKLPPTGGVIFFPAGTYLVRANEIVFTRPNTTFRGEAAGTTIIKRLSGEGSLLRTDPRYPVGNIVLEDLTFDGGEEQLVGSAIVVDGRHLTGPFRISRCQFFRPSLAAVALHHARDVIIEDSLFHAPGNATGTGIQSNLDAENITIRGNRFLWLRDSIIINSDDSGVLYPAQNFDISDNYFDGGWWLVKELYSGEGPTVRYEEKRLVDSSANFANLHTSPADVGHNVRVLPVKQAGTATFTATALTDPAARFITANLLRGEIIRADGAFGVVASVESEQTVIVEGWLGDSDRLPRDPPRPGSAYTAYGVILGSVWDRGESEVPYTATSINTPLWWDLQGKPVIPPDGTRYEVLVRRPNYTGIHAEAGFRDSVIRNNMVRRSWSDQISIYGGPNVQILNNWVEDGEDMGITLNGSFNLAEGNTVIHQGAGGIWVSGYDAVTDTQLERSYNVVRNNTIYDSQWVNSVATRLGDIVVMGNYVRVIGNITEARGNSLGYHGIVVSNTGNYLALNVTRNHRVAGIKVVDAADTILCDNEATVVEENSSGTIRSCVPLDTAPRP